MKLKQSHNSGKYDKCSIPSVLVFKDLFPFGNKTRIDSYRIAYCNSASLVLPTMVANERRTLKIMLMNMFVSVAFFASFPSWSDISKEKLRCIWKDTHTENANVCTPTAGAFKNPAVYFSYTVYSQWVAKDAGVWSTFETQLHLPKQYTNTHTLTHIVHGWKNVCTVTLQQSTNNSLFSADHFP